MSFYNNNQTVNTCVSITTYLPSTNDEKCITSRTLSNNVVTVFVSYLQQKKEAQLKAFPLQFFKILTVINQEFILNFKNYSNTMHLFIPLCA